MTASRPNLMFMISHDLGRHLGCYGIGTVQTPCIDRLAKGCRACHPRRCTAWRCKP